MLWSAATVIGLALASNVIAQISNSFPHAYPGMPTGDFSPDWQDYYLVTEPLPNVSFSLPRNWAGSVPVNRVGHPNNTLFFWAFEKQNGSLTSSPEDSSNEPWGIWLNGGPGASSMLGMLLENGPIHVLEDGSLVQNNFNWHQLVDYVWVDQPVGTGYSTADEDGFISDEDQMADDFLGFLTNLVKVFPSLASRPLFLTGESYAGTYIPYITKALFSSPSPPVKLAKIAIGNGAIGADVEFEELPMLSVIETYPQLINYDPDVYNYFKEQTHLCGYDLNLSYPQNGIFPSITFHNGLGGDIAFLKSRQSRRGHQDLKSIVRLMQREILKKRSSPLSESFLVEREVKRQGWKMEKRDLSGRPNGTIDTRYGCFLSAELEDYALNFSFPWSASPEVSNSSLDTFGPFNPYNIPDARAPPLNLDPTVFLNDNRTRTALHAPTSKDWLLQISYPFAGGLSSDGNGFGDPSPEPMTFLTELATNASQNNVAVIIYSGNDDSVVPHLSSEIVIQNTTFGGIQGFTRKPATPFTDDSDAFAGIVHQERNWTYALFNHAGHEVPEYAPQAAFVFFREFILGSNQTGLVTGSGKTTSVIGGESPRLLIGDTLPGQSDILYVSGSATTTVIFPSVTIAAWESFMAEEHPVSSSAAPTLGGGTSSIDSPILFVTIICTTIAFVLCGSL